MNAGLMEGIVPKPQTTPWAEPTNRHLCFVADNVVLARSQLLCWSRSIPNGWVWRDARL